MNRRLAILFGVIIASGAASVVVVSSRTAPGTPKAVRVFDRRCRGGCTDTALLRVLPGGPTSGQIATGGLSTSRGPVATTRASARTCTRADNVSYAVLGTNTTCVEGPGLAAELSGSNVLTDPNDFSTANWSRSNISSITTGDATCNPAPDGTSTAMKATPTPATSDSFIFQSVTNSTHAPFTGSVYVKWPSDTVPNSSNNSIGFFIDGSSTPTNTSTILPTYTWARYSLTTDFTGASQTSIRYILGSTNSWPAAHGPFCFWFAQLEQSSFPTSLITSASRSADVTSVASGMTGTPTSWCVNGVFTPEGGRSWSTALTLWDLGTDAAANSARVRTDASGNIIFDVYDGSGTVKTATTTSAPGFGVGMTHRIRACDASGTLSLDIDGVSKAVTGSGAGTGSLGSAPASFFPGASGNAKGNWSDICIGSSSACNATALTFNQVAALGDSITWGYNTTLSYPTDLMAEAGIPTRVFNYGVNGDTVSQMQTRWTATIRATKPNHLVFLGGVNDLLATTTAATIWTTIQTIADQARTDGDTVHLVTVLPFKNRSGWTSGMQTQLVSLNASILAYCTTNSLRCVDAYSAMGDTDPAALNALYDSGDGLHPNNAGAQKLADLVRAVLP